MTVLAIALKGKKLLRARFYGKLLWFSCFLFFHWKLKMLKVLGILFSLYFAIILVKHSHAGVKAADALAVKEKLLKLENYSASVH